MSNSNVYAGTGEQGKPGDWEDLPAVDHQALRHPRDYLAPQGLADAVNVALTLNMPLLVTGEPGVGKTRLAASLAWEFGFSEDDPLEFVVKSDTLGRDLFYWFDTLGRFHGGGKSTAQQFITFNALGSAILYAKGREKVRQLDIMLESELPKIPETPRRSVVLIDEIDKAPRDVPNDILAELDEMKFSIPELDRREVRLDDDEKRRYAPVVVITSNSEKDLPDAFLRRCVYYHIPFPKFAAEQAGGVTVEQIVERRLGDRFKGGDRFLADVLSLFAWVRQQRLDKTPSLAELLNWLYYLSEQYRVKGNYPERLTDIPDAGLLVGLSAVLKNQGDLTLSEGLVNEWRSTLNNSD
jgi:MoxR-like ATPase